MPTQTLHFDTSILPHDVLNSYDDAFYRMVGKVAGIGEAKLLEAQGIRGVYSFLSTPDVFEILTVPCAALKDVKKVVCLEADDSTYVVKPGCRSSIQYLYQLLLQKHEEYLKEIKLKPKQNRQLQSQQNNTNIMDLSQDSLEGGSGSFVHEQHTTTSDLTNKLYHHGFIIRMLNEWFDKNCHAMNVSNMKLLENEDFRLLFVFNGSSEEAYISCSCGIKIQLTKFRENFSLSNYYKHIKSTNCIMMKKKKIINSNIDNQTNTIDNHESFDDEPLQNTSIVSHTQSSADSITVDTTTNGGTSFKRSSIIQKRASSKRQRI